MKNIFYKREKKLANRGWAAMRTTLDREMPVERQRRRFFWLWWLLLPTLLAGGALAWQAWPESRAKDPESTRPPVATLKAERPVAGLAPPPGTMVAENPTRNSPAAAPNERPSKTSNAARKTREGSSRSTSRLDLTEPDTPDSMPAVSETDLSANAAGAAPFASSPALPQMPAFQRFPADFLPGSQPALPRPATPAVAGQWTEASIDPVRPPRRNGISFGLSAGLQSRDFSGVHGATAGFTADWAMNRRWGLRTGLHYGFERLRQTEQKIVSLAVPALPDTAAGGIIIEDVVVPDTTGITATPSYEVSAALQTSVIALHRIEAPLLVWWQPLDRWRLYAGGSVARILGAQIGRQRLLVGQNEFSAALLDNSDERLNQRANAEVRAWQLSMQGGIGFRPGRRWELNAWAQNLPRGIYPADALVVESANGSFSPGGYAPPTQRHWRFHLTATCFF